MGNANSTLSPRHDPSHLSLNFKSMFPLLDPDLVEDCVLNQLQRNEQNPEEGKGVANHSFIEDQLLEIFLTMEESRIDDAFKDLVRSFPDLEESSIRMTLEQAHGDEIEAKVMLERQRSRLEEEDKVQKAMAILSDQFPDLPPDDVANAMLSTNDNLEAAACLLREEEKSIMMSNTEELQASLEKARRQRKLRDIMEMSLMEVKIYLDENRDKRTNHLHQQISLVIEAFDRIGNLSSSRSFHNVLSLLRLTSLSFEEKEATTRLLRLWYAISGGDDEKYMKISSIEAYNEKEHDDPEGKLMSMTVLYEKEEQQELMKVITTTGYYEALEEEKRRRDEWDREEARRRHIELTRRKRLIEEEKEKAKEIAEKDKAFGDQKTKEEKEKEKEEEEKQKEKEKKEEEERQRRVSHEEAMRKAEEDLRRKISDQELEKKRKEEEDEKLKSMMMMKKKVADQPQPQSSSFASRRAAIGECFLKNGPFGQPSPGMNKVARGGGGRRPTQTTSSPSLPPGKLDHSPLRNRPRGPKNRRRPTTRK